MDVGTNHVWLNERLQDRAQIDSGYVAEAKNHLFIFVEMSFIFNFIIYSYAGMVVRVRRSHNSCIKSLLFSPCLKKMFALLVLA